MSSPARSLDKPKNSAAFLRFGLKQNWQQLVFYGIVMLLACVLPAVIGVNDELAYLSHHDALSRAENGGELLRSIAAIFAIVSCFIGVFSGMSATGYVNSRKAIHCYHSLPLTRDTLYLEGSLIQWIYYLVAGFSAMLIAFCCIVFQLGVTAPLLGDSILLIMAGIASYLMVFSLFQLAGSLTGTAVFRVVMAGLIAFLPVVVYFVFYGAAAIGIGSLIMEKYVDVEHIRWICPAYSAAYTIICIFEPHGYTGTLLRFPTEGALHAYGILFLLATAAVYFLLGLFFHRSRRSELSESSVIWPRLQRIVKYPVVFVCGAGGGILFRLLFGTDSTWMVFGVICGLLLSFMLMNVLIGRSIKVMFKGLTGLGITALAVTVFMVILPCDVFGLNRFMYEPNQVKSVTVVYGNTEVSLRDPEDVAAVMPYIRAVVQDTSSDIYPYDGYREAEDLTFYIDAAKVLNRSEEEAAADLMEVYPDRYVGDNRFVWTSGADWWGDAEKATDRVYSAVYSEETGEYLYGYTGDYSFTSEHLEISVYPKVGIPIHRYIRFMETSENAAILDTVLASEEYIQQYRDLAELEIEEVHSCKVHLMGEYVRMDMYDPSIPDWYREQVAGLLRAVSEFTAEMTDSPVIGEIFLDTYDGYNRYPLYADMEPFLDAWLVFWQEVPDKLKAYAYDDWGYQLNLHADMLRDNVYDLYTDGAAIYDWMATYYSDMYIIEAGTGRALAVDPAWIPEILRNGKLAVNEFTPGQADTRYLITARCFDSRSFAGMELPEDATAEDREALLEQYAVDYGTAASFFRFGAVPDFITEAFS